MVVTENNKLICSSQTISCLKEDIKYITTSKGNSAKQLTQQSAKSIALPIKLNTENKLGMK